MIKLYGAKQARIPRIEQGPRPKTLGVVVHDMEADNIDGVQHYFQTTSPDEVGAHLGISQHGETRQWADLDQVVYHAIGANHTHIGIELCGYASQPRSTWVRRVRQRRALAAAIARICGHYRLGVPHKGRNVFGHVDFPAGGHHDPGPNFPWDRVMKLAVRRYKRWFN